MSTNFLESITSKPITLEPGVISASHMHIIIFSYKIKIINERKNYALYKN